MLITDVQIFLATNALALVIAAIISGKAHIKHVVVSRRLSVLSLAITLITALSIIMYVQQSWLLNVLLNSHMGWMYPVGMLLVVGRFVLEYLNAELVEPLAREKLREENE